jgi:hypothetical protein
MMSSNAKEYSERWAVAARNASYVHYEVLWTISEMIPFPRNT